jgi:hypothetical protein
MRHLIMLPLIALSACTHDAPVAVEVRTVEIPVASPCLKREQIPAEPPKVGDQLTGNPVHDVLVLAESALGLRKWGQEQNALLTGCVG